MNVLHRNRASTRKICRDQIPGTAAVKVHPSQETSQKARKDCWAVAHPKPGDLVRKNSGSEDETKNHRSGEMDALTRLSHDVYRMPRQS